MKGKIPNKELKRFLIEVMMV